MKSIIILLLMSPSLSFAQATPEEIADKDKARLQGYDQLIPTGEKIIRLRAKLEKMSAFYPDIEGEKVHFYRESLSGKRKLLGSAVSGKNGFADFDVKDHKKGIARYVAELDPYSEYLASPAVLWVYQIDPKTPIAICDIDHTVSDYPELLIPWAESGNIKTLPYSEDVLDDVAADFQVVYITRRDDHFTNDTRKWMEIQNLPMGPMFFWDFDLRNLDLTASNVFKTNIIAEIKKKFSRVLVGFGDKDTDAMAYITNGLRAYIVNDGDPSEFPKGSHVFKSWEDIGVHLQRNPFDLKAKKSK